jgi:hypothetical protein
LRAAHRAAFQPDGGNTAQGHCARLFLDGGSDHLAQPALRRGETENQGNGQPLFFICAYVWLEKYFSRGDALAQAAFREFHARCFWFMRPDAEIVAEEVPYICERLRADGGRRGFHLAADLCR